MEKDYKIIFVITYFFSAKPKEIFKFQCEERNETQAIINMCYELAQHSNVLSTLQVKSIEYIL